MVELNTLGGVVKPTYEGEANTNAFTDAEKNKLAAIEAAADVTDAANVEAAGALMDSEVVNLADVKAFDPADYAAAAHTHPASQITDFNAAADARADARIAAASVGDLSDVVTTGITDGQLLAWNNSNSRFEAVDPAAGGGSVDSVNGFTGVVVLDADDIDDAATVNKFVSQAQIDKLAAIQPFADVTDTANVTNAGAVMDSEVTNLAAVKAFDPADYAAASHGHTLADISDAGTAAAAETGDFATSEQGTLAATALQSVAGDATPQLSGELDAQGNIIGGFKVKTITGVSGTLTDAVHSGNRLKTTGNVTVPTNEGFTCQLVAGGAHTVTFNGTTTAAMAAGDLMSITVVDATTIVAALLPVADQVEFV